MVTTIRAATEFRSELPDHREEFMGIMDNEGHDPQGFGNVPRSTDELRARAQIERLRAALGTSYCPRPANGAPNFLTVSECMARGECGCDSGSALGFTHEQDVSK